MGCCQSNEVHDGKARNEEIDNQIKRDKLNMRNEVKMLLLGKEQHCYPSCCSREKREK